MPGRRPAPSGRRPWGGSRRRRPGSRTPFRPSRSSTSRRAPARPEAEVDVPASRPRSLRPASTGGPLLARAAAWRGRYHPARPSTPGWTGTSRSTSAKVRPGAPRSSATHAREGRPAGIVYRARQPRAGQPGHGAGSATAISSLLPTTVDDSCAASPGECRRPGRSTRRDLAAGRPPIADPRWRRASPVCAPAELRRGRPGVPRVVDRPPAGQHREARQPEVDPASADGGRQQGVGAVDDERGSVPTRRALDGTDDGAPGCRGDQRLRHVALPDQPHGEVEFSAA